MSDDRPGFTHRRERHGLIGPFGGRQLALGFALVVVAVIVSVVVTTPLGAANQNLLVDPKASPYVIGPAVEGLRPGNVAPDFTVATPDGTTYQLTDLDGAPIRLADLRGKVVWLNFWAHWCPPCQQETPIIRDLADTYRDQGLEVVAVAVQETSPADVAQYAATYQLDYTIGFDASGYVFHTYKVYALPTQFFIDRSGVIRTVANGPVDATAAEALIRSMLAGESPGASPGGSPGASPGGSPGASPSKASSGSAAQDR